jgi:MarR family 2-MHQ and catechol resistance regulon transcriptional repressor
MPESDSPRHSAEDPATEAALKLWVVLSRAHAAVAAQAAEDAARHDLTLAEFGILESLYHKGPMLLGEVQRKILVSSGGITYLVDRLEERGLVERRACPADRRARYAALTPQGEQFVTAIFPAHAERIRTAVAALDQEEQRVVTGLLRTLGVAAATPSRGSAAIASDESADDSAAQADSSGRSVRTGHASRVPRARSRR